jgi:hypothetical protein
LVTPLRRTTRSEIPKAQRWQKSAVWDVERTKIEAWLDEHANAAAGGIDTTYEAALASGAGLAEQVQATFGAEGAMRSAQLINDVETGKVERKAPSEGAIIAIAFFKYVCMSCETLIFVWMYVLGLANPMVIILGVLLASGGFMLGRGGGRLIIHREEEHNLGDPIGWILTIVGIAVIGLISWLRSSGEQEGATAIVTITAVLALAIALFELSHYAMKSHYREQHEKMFLVQQWFATDRATKEYTNGLWKNIYEASVKRHWNQTHTALGNPERVIPLSSPTDALAMKLEGSSLPSALPFQQGKHPSSRDEGREDL